MPRALRPTLTLLLVWALALAPAVVVPAMAWGGSPAHACCTEAEPGVPTPARTSETGADAPHACCTNAAEPQAPHPADDGPPCEDPCGTCFFCPAARPLLAAPGGDESVFADGPAVRLIAAPEPRPASLALAPTPPPPRS